MSRYAQLRFEVSEGIATLTLDRPDKLNAYVPELGDELVDAFGRVRDDPAVRVIVLAGAGRAFCAGVDLERLRASRSGDEGGRRLGEEAFLTSFPAELAAFPKPVIAAIQGAAVGVGVTMTLPCDVRLAAEDAVLSLPFARLGIVPGLGSTHLLPRLVGRARALELVLSGRKVAAPEAAAIGLVNRVVPSSALPKEARELARAMAAASAEVLAATKRALLFGAEAPFAAALRNEAEENAALARSRKEH